MAVKAVGVRVSSSAPSPRIRRRTGVRPHGRGRRRTSRSPQPLALSAPTLRRGVSKGPRKAALERRRLQYRQENGHSPAIALAETSTTVLIYPHDEPTSAGRPRPARVAPRHHATPQLSTIHHSLFTIPLSHFAPRCLTPDRAGGTPVTHFPGQVSHRPDTDGTEWNRMEHIFRNRPRTSAGRGPRRGRPAPATLVPCPKPRPPGPSGNCSESQNACLPHATPRATRSPRVAPLL